jgi:GNAT superfamily N-acetyltransferase
MREPISENVENQHNNESFFQNFALETFHGADEIQQSGIIEEIATAIKEQVRLVQELDPSTPGLDDQYENIGVLNNGRNILNDIFGMTKDVCVDVIRDRETNALAGFGITPVNDKGEVIFSFFGALPNYHGKGIGTVLLKQRCKYLYERGIHSFETSVWHRSERIYRKLGLPYKREADTEVIKENGVERDVEGTVILKVDLSELPKLPWFEEMAS